MTQGSASPSLKNALTLCLTGIVVASIILGSLILVLSWYGDDGGLDPTTVSELQGAVLALVLAILGIAWMAYDILARHFEDIRQLRTTVLFATATPSGTHPRSAAPTTQSPPPSAQPGFSGSATTAQGIPAPGQPGSEIAAVHGQETQRLQEAVQTLITQCSPVPGLADDRLSAIIGSLSEGVIAITEHGQIRVMNEAAKSRLAPFHVTVGGSIFTALSRLSVVAALDDVAPETIGLSYLLFDVDGQCHLVKISRLTRTAGLLILFPHTAALTERSALSPRALAPEGLSPNSLFLSNQVTDFAPLAGENVIDLTLRRAQKAAHRYGHRQTDTCDLVTLPTNHKASPPIRGSKTANHDRPRRHQGPPTDIDPATPLIDLPVLVFDTESTGLDIKTDRLVQIGGVRVHGDRIFPVATIDRLLNPHIPIPPSATAIHGLTNGMVASMPTFVDLWPSLSPLMRGAVMVGHAIAFDIAMLRRECALAAIPFAPPPTLDTLLLASLLLADRIKDRPTLDSVAAALDVDCHGRHTALGDALMTAEIYVRLIPLMNKAGIHTYGEAYVFSRRATHLLAQHQAMGW